MEYRKRGILFYGEHCRIGAAAAECLGFCDAELSNFKKLIGNGFQIERVEHIRSGEHRCIHKISYTTESLQNLLILLINRLFL